MEVNKKDMRLLDLTPTWSVVVLMILVFISLLVEPSVHGLSSNHNLSLKYDFHGYMVRSMEEEFQRIVGVRFKSLFLESYYACYNGTNYKAAVIPQRIRERWKKAAKRRKRYGSVNDDSTIHTQTTVFLLEEDEHELYDGSVTDKYTDIKLQPTPTITASPSPIAADENSSQAATPLLWPSSSLSSMTSFGLRQNDIPRSPFNAERVNNCTLQINVLSFHCDSSNAYICIEKLQELCLEFGCCRVLEKPQV